MAHVQKNNRTATGHLFDHYGRNAEEEQYKYLYRENNSIAPERTCLNYNLAKKEGTQKEILEKRLSEVKVLNRKDVNVMCSWVVTVPKDLPEEKHKEFFEQTFEFLEKRYGEKNTISAYVHNDETTPHLHYAFVPVTVDKKKDIEKLSAKEVIDRKDLQTFHQDLEKHLEKHFGREVGILNEATREGNKSIEELKRGTAIDELQKLKNEVQQAQNSLGTIKNNLEAFRDIQMTQDDIKSIETKKTVLGAITDEIKVHQKDFERICNLAIVSSELKKENEKLKKENQENRERRNDNYDKFNKADSQRVKFGNELYDLRKEYDKVINWLKGNDLYEQFEVEQQKVQKRNSSRSR